MKHIVVGLLASVLGVWGIIVWWSTFAAVMRGVVPFALLVFGLIAILSGSRRVVLTEKTEETETAAADEEKAEPSSSSEGEEPAYAE